MYEKTYGNVKQYHPPNLRHYKYRYK